MATLKWSKRLYIGINLHTHHDLIYSYARASWSFNYNHRLKKIWEQWKKSKLIGEVKDTSIYVSSMIFLFSWLLFQKKLKDVYADKTFHLDLQIELCVSKILIVILFNYKIKSIGKLRAGSYRRFKTKSPLAMPGYVITVLFLQF